MAIRILSPLPRGKSIVVVSPHPDDSCIHAGGLLARISQQNSVHVLVMTAGNRAAIKAVTSPERKTTLREHEVVKESKILGFVPHFLRLGMYDTRKILKQDVDCVARHLEEIHPSLLLLPHKDDRHHTHLLCREVALRALKRKMTIWGYDSVWSLLNSWNVAVPFDKKVMQLKMRAIRCHASQLERLRYDHVAFHLARLRAETAPEYLAGHGKKGKRIGEFAEVFFEEIL